MTLITTGIGQVLLKKHHDGAMLSKQYLFFKLCFTPNLETLMILGVRRDGRVVECTGLENRHGFVAHLGFKSLSLRHIYRKSPLAIAGFFVSGFELLMKWFVASQCRGQIPISAPYLSKEPVIEK